MAAITAATGQANQGFRRSVANPGGARRAPRSCRRPRAGSGSLTKPQRPFSPNRTLSHKLQPLAQVNTARCYIVTSAV